MDCPGRSPYATVLPDDDGTQNQGGFANPALVIADYLTAPRDQFGLGATLTSDSIATVIAAANICDEAEAIEVFADGTTLYERRYACNGAFESTTAYGDVLKSLSLSMAGYVVPPGDCWRIYAGSYVPPSLALGDDDCARRSRQISGSRARYLQRREGAIYSRVSPHQPARLAEHGAGDRGLEKN